MPKHYGQSSRRRNQRVGNITAVLQDTNAGQAGK
jgi:hypothetical protein